LGNYLLERGMINQPDLFSFLRRQIEETCYSILLLRQGDFFLTQYDVSTLNSPFTLNAQSLLMEGLRRMDEMDYYGKRIPSTAHRVERVADASGPDEALGERCATIWRLIEEPVTIEALTRQSRFGRFETTKQVFHLLERSLVQILAPDEDDVNEQKDEEHLNPEWLIERFNVVFNAIARSAGPAGLDLEHVLGRFIALYGFDEILGGVQVQEDEGRLDMASLLENLARDGGTKPEALSQPLNELLFFVLFSVRAQLGTPERSHVQRMVNRLYLELG
jgi:hypothetical protein